jgi:hypothetical protein
MTTRRNSNPAAFGPGGGCHLAIFLSVVQHRGQLCCATDRGAVQRRHEADLGGVIAFTTANAGADARSSSWSKSRCAGLVELSVRSPRLGSLITSSRAVMMSRSSGPVSCNPHATHATRPSDRQSGAARRGSRVSATTPLAYRVIRATTGSRNEYRGGRKKLPLSSRRDRDGRFLLPL